MIDERRLADPARCPACGADLVGGSRSHCPECGVHLQGATAARLWRVSVDAAALLDERARLIESLRREAWEQPRPAVVVPDTTAAAFDGPGQSSLAPPGRLPPAYAARPRAEWTPQRVQTLLLALGVGLLAVAAVIFVAVSWGRLGVGGRAAVLTGVTALSAGAAWWTHRRGLGSTAEALSVLTVGLGLLDCFGAWSADLAGLRSVDGATAAGLSFGLVGALAGAGRAAVRTTALQVLPALLLQLVLPLLVADLAAGSEHPVAVFATGILLNVALGGAALLRWGTGASEARAVVVVGTLAAGGVAIPTALGAAYGEPGSLVAGTVLIVAWGSAFLLAADAWVALRPAANVPWRPVTSAVGAALLVLGLWAPVTDRSPDRWTLVALAATALALLIASLALPADRRRPPATVLLVASWLPATAALVPLVAVLTGRLLWLDAAWTSRGGSAEAMLTPPGVADLALDVATAWPAVVLCLLAAGSAAAAANALGRIVHVATPAWLLGAGLLAPVALDLPYAAGLGADLLLAAVGLTGGLLARSRGWDGIAASAGLAGVVGLVAAIAWSFGTSDATVVVVPLAAALLGVVVGASRRDTDLHGLRLAGVAAAVGLVAAEAGLLTRRAGGSDPAVAVAVLTVLAVLAGSAVVLALRGEPPTRSTWRSASALVACAAVVADVAAIVLWAGAEWPSAALGLAVASALLLVAASGPVVPHRLSLLAEQAYVVGAAGATAGLLLSGSDPSKLWLALLAVGAAVAVLGVRVDDRLGWLSGLLLTASSWVRLAESDVTMPEAYTVPPGLALLAVGFRKRRSDEQVRSWRAYGPGLGLVLLPSLLRSLTDSGNTRPLLLALAALAVLAVGVARRLQAPLVLGAGVLAVDALVQLSPYLAMAYEVVPRWVTIGLVGLALLGAGATYEKRLADVRRVAQQLGSLG